MSEKTVALILKSPMQSWGISSKFGLRGTFEYPTKSAIAGIICAAAGIDKYSADASAALDKLSQFKLDTLRVVPASKNGKTLQAPLLNDYHTVGAGYVKDMPEHRGMARATVLSNRKYIQDACFIALLTAEEWLCNKIACVLKNPKWGVWLGRKCCIPSLPIFAGIADTPFEAEQEAVGKLKNFGEIAVIGRCLHVKNFAESEMSIPDEPRDFNSRNFSSRNIITALDADI